MTALHKYDRLESTGLWRDAPEAQRRDVQVSFGHASLVIRNRAEAPLAHWSLAAIERLNPSERPALYQPGPDTGETLEIDDDEMIAAIEKVRRAIARKRPRHGRVRLAIVAATIAIIAALGAFWLPGALTRQAVAVVPDSKRAAIGDALLTHMVRLTGQTCDSPLGVRSLDRLTARVLDDRVRRVHIVPESPHASLLLPGKLLLIDKTRVEDFETPEVIAGDMIAGTQTEGRPDPLVDLLKFGGPRTSFTLLTTGEMSETVLRDYARVLLNAAPDQPRTEELVDRFSKANVALSPYAYALDITGASTSELIEADPFKDAEPTPRLISDGDWISLQEICEA